MTNMNKEQLVAARQQFEVDFDAACRKAEAHMALDDVATELAEDSPEFEEAREQAYEDRFHCEVCVVREVMQIVWSAAEGYIALLERALDLDETTNTETSPSVTN